MDDSVRNLHFEGEHYATLRSSELETPDEHLTLPIGDGRKWRVESLRGTVMKKEGKDRKKITIMDESNLLLCIARSIGNFFAKFRIKYYTSHNMQLV